MSRNISHSKNAIEFVQMFVGGVNGTTWFDVIEVVVPRYTTHCGMEGRLEVEKG